MAVTGSAFAITFGIYSIVALVFFLCFGILRNKLKFKKFYAPKCYMPAEKVVGYSRPPLIPKALFSWMGPVLSFDQRQVLAYSGMDGLTMMRILYFGLIWSIAASVLCLAACLPVNLVGDEIDKLSASNDDSNYSTLDKFTMGNIPQRNATIVVHVVVTYALSLLGFYMLWKWHKQAVGLRINFLANRPKGAETNTVLITDVPGIIDGMPVDRAMFAIPAKKRGPIREKLLSAAGGVTGQGAGAVGKMGNCMFDCCIGTCNKIHRGKDAHPSTRFATSGEPTYAAPLATPRQQVVDVKVGSAYGANGSQFVDTVSGIPLEAELGAWPKANRMISSGMSPAQMVDTEFREVFGDDYVESQLVYNTSEVNSLHAEYEKRYEKMLDTFDMWTVKASQGKLVKKGKPVEQPTTRVVGAKWGAWGKEKYGSKPSKQGVIDFNVARMEELRKLILEKQQEAMGKPASAAFATFSNRVKQTLVATSLIHHDTSSWLSKEAPSPEEVLWPNLRIRAWERTLRKSLGVAAYIALVLLFMIPVTAIQGIISSASWLDFMKDIAPLNAVYTAVVPTLALKVFMAILPFILRALTYAEGVTSITDLDLGLQSKFYGFQYVVIFLTTLIGGALLGQLDAFINDPSSIVSILGTSVPQQAIFFATFIMLEALIITPFELADLVGLIIFKIKGMIFGSERAKARVWQEQYVSYGKKVGKMMLSSLLIMVFSPVFPIMAPLGVLWFTMAIVCWKYKLCYTWRPRIESGGNLWPKVYWQILINLFSMQAVVCFVCSVKKDVAAAIALIPLMVITPLFGYVANKHFKRPLAIMSLRAAADQDTKDAALALKDVEGADTALGAYQQPVMKWDEQKHQDIKVEAARWQALFASGSYNPGDFTTQGDDDVVPQDDPMVVRLKSVKKPTGDNRKESQAGLLPPANDSHTTV